MFKFRLKRLYEFSAFKSHSFYHPVTRAYAIFLT
nr:MAG TPA: hypothetical protein [Caudoviricetes sp.]